MTQKPMAAGRVRLGLSMLGTFTRASHEVDPGMREPGLPDDQQPRRHALAIGLLQWAVDAQLSVHPRLGFDAVLPIRLSVVDATFTDAEGDRLDIDSIHHRDESIFGLGDLQLTSRLGIIRPNDVRGLRLDYRAGLTFPTGPIQPDPFAAGEQGERHQHIFYGNGTFDPLVGIETVYDRGRWGLSGWVQARIPLTRNRYDYRGSRIFAAGAGPYSGFGLVRWRFILQPEVYWESPADFAGQSARNSGRTSLLASAGAFVQPKPNIGIYVLAKVPFYNKARGGQLRWPFVGIIGFNYTFDLKRKRPKHDHEDEHE